MVWRWFQDNYIKSYVHYGTNQVWRNCLNDLILCHKPVLTFIGKYQNSKENLLSNYHNQFSK